MCIHRDRAPSLNTKTFSEQKSPRDFIDTVVDTEGVVSFPIRMQIHLVRLTALIYFPIKYKFLDN